MNNLHEIFKYNNEKYLIITIAMIFDVRGRERATAEYKEDDIKTAAAIIIRNNEYYDKQVRLQVLQFPGCTLHFSPHG
jgi:hypothetical protein